jgi:hypothetical protein
MNQITKLMASVTVLIAANALILVAYNGITVYHSGTVAEYLWSSDHWLEVCLEEPLVLKVDDLGRDPLFAGII